MLHDAATTIRTKSRSLQGIAKGYLMDQGNDFQPHCNMFGVVRIYGMLALYPIITRTESDTIRKGEIASGSVGRFANTGCYNHVFPLTLPHFMQFLSTLGYIAISLYLFLFY